MPTRSTSRGGRRLRVAHKRRGDATDLMLDYVGYDLEALRQSYRARIASAGIGGDEAAACTPRWTAASRPIPICHVS
ncbi:hypothetical protein RLIN73S_07223 [Rhodanobacter lindaniclasticus]